MIDSLLKRSLILFIMLAFVGQGLLSDGRWMISETQAHEAQMSHGAMMVTSNTHSDSDCHDEKNTFNPPVSTDRHFQMSNFNNKSCCDSDEQCLDECKHCLVISMTASLMVDHSWLGFSPSEHPMAASLPHFHSISPSQNLRPPIA